MGSSNYHSWSFTRSRLLAECPRQALFEYFARGEPESKQAWNLKELQTLPMMAGSAVDFIIAATLGAYRKDGETKTNLARAGRRWYRKCLSESGPIVGLMRTRPRSAQEREESGFQPLHHHFHRLDLGTEYEKLMEDRVAGCLDTFEASEVWEKLRSVGPTKWGPITRRRYDVPRFKLDGITVYASFDIWLKDGETVVILDWKSGSPNPQASANAQRQLAVYALYALTVMKRLRPVKTQAVWLGDSGEYVPRDVNEGALIEIKDTIRSENSAELSVLQVTDFPSGRKRYLADRVDFPARPSARRCSTCKYQTICPEGVEATAHVSRIQDVQSNTEPE